MFHPYLKVLSDFAFKTSTAIFYSLFDYVTLALSQPNIERIAEIVNMEPRVIRNVAPETNAPFAP